MTLRRKFNGAKLCTEAWDFTYRTRRIEVEKDLATTESALNPSAKSLKAKFSTRMVGERSIRGEVRAKALVDCMEVRMPE